MNLENVVQQIKSAPPNSKLYLGADSVRFKKKDGSAWAKITLVIVLHLAQRNGCKVIGENRVERVYDNNLARPHYRMMLETYALADLYQTLQEALFEEGIDIPIELHLDIASDPKHGSNCAAKQAAGYIQGMCQVTPILKPDAFAASFAADNYNRKVG